ncbi:MAG: helix-turn-helix domain-containing protein [Verrucomicrobia bacterium]|nr:helix-turn-helix domain-containing protein [Verrucomicrobiota bacterium]
MPRISPFQIELTAQERGELESRAVKYTLPYYQVLRAKMVLYAPQGLSNDDIARCLDTRREVVSQWRKRFFEERLAERSYEAMAKPFEWKFTRNDLAQLMQRLAPHSPTESALAA